MTEKKENSSWHSAVLLSYSHAGREGGTECQISKEKFRGNFSWGARMGHSSYFILQWRDLPWKLVFRKNTMRGNGMTFTTECEPMQTRTLYYCPLYHSHSYETWLCAICVNAPMACSTVRLACTRFSTHTARTIENFDLRMTSMDHIPSHVLVSSTSYQIWRSQKFLPIHSSSMPIRISWIQSWCVLRAEFACFEICRNFWLRHICKHREWHNRTAGPSDLWRATSSKMAIPSAYVTRIKRTA